LLLKTSKQIIKNLSIEPGALLRRGGFKLQMQAEQAALKNLIAWR